MSGMKTKRQATAADVVGNSVTADVLTLPEAAAYLRVPEEEVLRMVREQALPARRLGTEWRFLKSAVQEWLGQPLLGSKSKGIWALICVGDT